MQEEKEIIVTDLKVRTVVPKPGATWKTFNVYQIQANDGITYETTDHDFFQGLAIGSTVKITFKTETKTVNGRVYTTYKLLLPKKADPAIENIKEEILNRIDLMEKNIIAALKFTIKKGKPIEVIKEESTDDMEAEYINQPSLFEVEPESTEKGY